MDQLADGDVRCWPEFRSEDVGRQSGGHVALLVAEEVEHGNVELWPFPWQRIESLLVERRGFHPSCWIARWTTSGSCALLAQTSLRCNRYRLGSLRISWDLLGFLYYCFFFLNCGFSSSVHHSISQINRNYTSGILKDLWWSSRNLFGREGSLWIVRDLLFGRHGSVGFLGDFFLFDASFQWTGIHFRDRSLRFSPIFEDNKTEIIERDGWLGWTGIHFQNPP